MEKLRTEVKRDIFTHNLIKRNKWVALYDVCLEGEVIGYEVFIIRSQEEGESVIKGKVYHMEAKELFPSNNDFGYSAYAPSRLERAEELYIMLTGRMEMKHRGISVN